MFSSKKEIEARKMRTSWISKGTDALLTIYLSKKYINVNI